MGVKVSTAPAVQHRAARASITDETMADLSDLFSGFKAQTVGTDHGRLDVWREFARDERAKQNDLPPWT